MIFCYLAEVFTRSSLREIMDLDETSQSSFNNTQLAIQTFSKEHKLPELQVKEMSDGKIEPLLNAVWVNSCFLKMESNRIKKGYDLFSYFT